MKINGLALRVPRRKETDMIISLGERVKDKISGFEGIACARSEYLNGCKRILIEPTKLKDDGTLIDGQWFDSQQIELLGPGINAEQNPSGGPQVTPRRAQDPR
ncbi:MAG: hypothetical protein QME44_04480 [Thermodesulfobacteriota bacterium]|nr:hypothetical protein [Thermodesulfobacteriota bacterium]